MKTNDFLFRGKLASLMVTLLLLFSCSTENELLEETGELESKEEAEQKAAPVVGDIFYIQNVHSGKYLDVSNLSNSNGANIHQWSLTRAKNQQWEILNTGSGTVRFKSLQSGKSLDVVNKSNSNGANVQQWAYGSGSNQKWTMTNVGNDQYRITNVNSGKVLDVAGWSTSNGGNVHQFEYRGQANQKWRFVRVSGSGGGGSGSAADILGGLNVWKLNAYSGNLNVSSSNNGLRYVDDASKSDNNNWFYGSNGYAYFKTYPGNPTSGGSSNPRTELREMNSNGSLANWDGTTSREHSIKWKFRIDDLPPSGKLCFGQIHEYDNNLDDIIRVQCEGSSGQNSGSIKLRILGYVTEELLGSGQTVDFDFRMDTEYYFELTMRNRVVRLYQLNNSGSRIRTLFTSKEVNANENYFKAGCYLQSTSSSHRNSSVFGLVGIKEISVSH